MNPFYDIVYKRHSHLVLDIYENQAMVSSRLVYDNHYKFQGEGWIYAYLPDACFLMADDSCYN